MQISFIIFLVVLFLLWSIEYFFPRKKSIVDKKTHYQNNIGWTIINTIFSRLILQISPVLIAIWGESQGYGLFHVITVPEWLMWIVGLTLLDLSIYLQHVSSHVFPLFWRLHQVHHLDRHIDVTSGFRFHICEILLSFGWKAIVILLLGVSGNIVIVFEIILSSMAMFSHANIRIPSSIDRYLRYIVVTPDMHRIHHSIIHTETDSNYGFALSLWDRIFHTYTRDPEHGHDNMKIGLQYQQKENDLSFWQLCIQPLKKLKKKKNSS